VIDLSKPQLDGLVGRVPKNILEAPKCLGSKDLDPIAAIKSPTLYIERNPIFGASNHWQKFAYPLIATKRGERLLYTSTKPSKRGARVRRPKGGRHLQPLLSINNFIKLSITIFMCVSKPAVGVGCKRIG
jgi:hypothetical protein